MTNNDRKQPPRQWLLPPRLCGIVAWVALALLALECLLAIASWMLAAMSPGEGPRSLLSGDGLRWLLGGMVGRALTPALAWILMGGMAAGIIRHSRLHEAMASYRRLGYLERRALVAVAWEVVAAVAIVAALTLLPHAVLLSAVGCLRDSSFSRGVVPLALAMASVAGLTYGSLTGQIDSMAKAFNAVVDGVVMATPVLLVCWLAMELWRSVEWVVA